MRKRIIGRCLACGCKIESAICGDLLIKNTWCVVCGFGWCPEGWKGERLMLYSCLKKGKDRLWVSVPEGCMAVFGEGV